MFSTIFKYVQQPTRIRGTIMTIYDDGISLWEQRRNAEIALDAATAAAITAANLPSVYLTGGTLSKEAYTTQLASGGTTEDSELTFYARGAKSFSVSANLMFSGAPASDGLEISISGTNSGSTFLGYSKAVFDTVSSAATTQYTTGQTCSFSATSAFNTVQFYGIYSNGTKPYNVDDGTIGIYWKQSGATQIDLLPNSTFTYKLFR